MLVNSGNGPVEQSTVNRTTTADVARIAQGAGATLMVAGGLRYALGWMDNPPTRHPGVVAPPGGPAQTAAEAVAHLRQYEGLAAGRPLDDIYSHNRPTTIARVGNKAYTSLDDALSRKAIAGIPGGNRTAVIALRSGEFYVPAKLRSNWDPATEAVEWKRLVLDEQQPWFGPPRERRVATNWRKVPATSMTPQFDAIVGAAHSNLKRLEVSTRSFEALEMEHMNSYIVDAAKARSKMRTGGVLALGGAVAAVAGIAALKLSD